jgi:hypothetical protein
MTIIEYRLILTQAEILQTLMPAYSGKTIDNILSQLKARIKEYEKRV